jgi:hypothetical protein
MHIASHRVSAAKIVLAASPVKKMRATLSTDEGKSPSRAASARWKAGYEG